MLTQWKRHSATCLAALKEKKIPASELRFFKQCQCACWVTGIHPETKKYIKQSLGTTSWEAGERFKKKLEESGNGETKAEPVTIKKALDAWVEEQERLGAASTTVASYDCFVKRILEFAQGRGIVLLRQLDYDACYDMIKSWKNGAATTKGQRISRLRSIFRFAMANKKWGINENPAALIKAPRNTAARVTVDPFEPEEVERIEAALDTWTVGRRICNGLWSLRPATLKCLTHVFRDTGLRVSDAQRVRPAIIEVLPDGSGVCTLIQTKTDYRPGGDVTVYLQASTLEEMKSVPWLSEKYPFMIECENENDRNLFKEHLRREGAKIYMALQEVGKAAGVKGSCRPHRFRHYFAVEKLKNKWALEDVSHMLGHADIDVTNAHYAKWTKSRQERLQEKVLNDWNSQHKVIEFKKQA